MSGNKKTPMSSSSSTQPTETGQEDSSFQHVVAEEAIRRDINRIEDLTAKEKEMMILWNSFMFKENKVAGYTPDPGSLVVRFAESYGKVIMDSDLYGEFLLHIMNLSDFGLLGETTDFNSLAQIVQSQSAANNATTAA